MHRKSKTLLITLLLVTVTLNIMVWLSVRETKLRWLNVPPAPSVSQVLWGTLGDRQLAYRSYGIIMQNFGDTGGRTASLKDYDYAALGQWFGLMHALDARSNYVPFLAGYYFGAENRLTDKLAPVVDYLELAAGNGEGQKWRWLAHASYLARFRMRDYERSLELANKLAAMYNPSMPEWTRQWPAFILNQSGDKEAAYNMLLSLLKTNGKSLPPAEVNATLAYICEQVLTPDQASKDPLCQNYE